MALWSLRIKMKLGMQGRPRPWPHCVRWGTWDPALPPPKGHTPPIFGPYQLRPNGCMDQDVTWYGTRPRPRRLCVRWGPRSLPKKGAEPPPPKKIGPCFLWPNGWMHQDATWYGGRPQPRRCCVRWGPSPPQRGSLPQFSVHVYCGQTAGWMKMPLGTVVDLGPCHIVSDGDPVPRKRGTASHVSCGHGRPSQQRLTAESPYSLQRAPFTTRETDTLAATLRGSRPGVQSASLIMTSLMTS